MIQYMIFGSWNIAGAALSLAASRQSTLNRYLLIAFLEKARDASVRPASIACADHGVGRSAGSADDVKRGPVLYQNRRG